MERGISLINRAICTKHGLFGSSPGKRTAKALTFSRGFVGSPAVGRHSTPATANKVCPNDGIALNRSGCRVVLHRLASVGDTTTTWTGVPPLVPATGVWPACVVLSAPDTA